MFLRKMEDSVPLKWHSEKKDEEELKKKMKEFKRVISEKERLWGNNQHS
jgi:hypothetical protein